MLRNGDPAKAWSPFRFFDASCAVAATGNFDYDAQPPCQTLPSDFLNLVST
jgi:hypothetical protein